METKVQLLTLAWEAIGKQVYPSIAVNAEWQWSTLVMNVNWILYDIIHWEYNIITNCNGLQIIFLEGGTLLTYLILEK